MDGGTQNIHGYVYVNFQTRAALELGEHGASLVWTDAPKFYTTAVQLCTGWIDRLDLGSKGH